MHRFEHCVRGLGSAALVALLAAACLLPSPPAAAQGAPPAAEEAPTADAAPVAADVHPFYRQLLDRGIYAYQQGDAATAARELRLAVFGLLEEPPLLTRGLAHLALAQQAAGEPEAAGETLGRLVVVADRFSAYAVADLSPEIRQRLEALMVEKVAEATLAGSDTFRRLADERLRQRLAALPPKQRRAALAQAVAQRPDDPSLRVDLAELELAEGDAAEAARLAGEALAAAARLSPAEQGAAHCVRGLALAETGACAAAVEPLARCPRGATDATVARAHLDCRAELGQWRQAADFLTTVAPAVREARPVARLARRVDKQAARLAAAEAEAEVEQEQERQAVTPQSAAPAAGTDGAVEPQAADVLDPAARQRLAEARRGLDAASTAAELQEPLSLARSVADAHPRSVEAQHLVGEIAYRASAWEEAARYFRRGGEPQRPELRFYLAVALFESGDTAAAQDVLQRALPELPRNPFVDSYTERIQNAGR